MDNFYMFWLVGIKYGELVLFVGDVRISFIDVWDIVDSVVVVFISDCFDGKVFNFIGVEVLSYI